MKPFLLMTFLMLAGAAIAEPAKEESGNLLPNGNFEADTKGAGWPDFWAHPQGATWEVEEGNHFVRLKSEKPGQMVMVFRAIEIKPEYKALELSFRARHADIKVGTQSWFDGRIMMNFKDAAGETLKPGPKAPTFKGTSKGWVDKSQKIEVPEGAKSLEMMLTLFNVASGSIDFDDLKLVSVEKTPATIAPMPVDNPASLPPELHVAGNQLQTAQGKMVWLQGLAVPSLEWSVGGEKVLKSIEVGIDQWKANAIRLPVNEQYWFGRAGAQKDGGESYRKLVDQAVGAAGSRGAYLILDLHRFRAPTTEHVEFWKDAALRYRNHPAVLFDLFNEPHGISWEIWRDGGEVTDKPKTDAPAENKEKLKKFKSVGMQALVDAVRKAGAKNIVIAGGLDWGYDLSGVAGDFALKDPEGNGIMYSSHIYEWKGNWQKKVLDAAAKYPIFVGEVGADKDRMPFIPAERHEDPAVFAPDVLGLIQKNKLNWTAWAFHPKAGPKVLADWNYTPTEYWGVYVKRALAGEAFEMKKMR